MRCRMKLFNTNPNGVEGYDKLTKVIGITNVHREQNEQIGKNKKWKHQRNVNTKDIFQFCSRNTYIFLL